jgi:hypothetical protein
MSTKRYTVTCHWDKEAEVWYVAETDVPGLATEASNRIPTASINI